MFKLKNVKYRDIIDIEELRIKKSVVTTIVGASGSGKTTLLSLLNKLISNDSGEILFNGENLSTLNSVEHRRQVVMLPQNPAIFEGTIRDNLQIGLQFAEKNPATDEQLITILSALNIHSKLTDDAEKLSGGEKQRVALARVLLMGPEVLLLDEPSSALDKETEGLIIKEVVSYVKENNKTLIMVSHSENIASNFSDEIIRIEKN